MQSPATNFGTFQAYLEIGPQPVLVKRLGLHTKLSLPSQLCTDATMRVPSPFGKPRMGRRCLLEAWSDDNRETATVA